MSINLTALLDHSLEWDRLIRLNAILQSEWQREGSPLLALPRLTGTRHGNWTWTLSATFSSASEELFDAGHVRFESPTGLSGTAFRHAIQLRHVARWSSFLCEESVRTPLRAVILRIAALIGGRTVVFLPDSTYTCSTAGDLLYDGKDLQAVLAWLDQNCGPPAKSIVDIYRETDDSWEGDGYHVEVVPHHSTDDRPMT